MGQVVLGAVAPHPPILIPEVGRGEEAKAASTIKGMRALSRLVSDINPDTVVIISPHGPVFRDAYAITAVSAVRAELSRFGARLGLSFNCDLELANAIDASASKAGMSTVLLGEVEMKRYGIEAELDHGTAVPAYFLRQEQHSFALLPIAMGTGLPHELYEFGIVVNGAIRSLKHRRVAIVASGDLSHKLSESAPGGFSPEGSRFDALVVEALEKRDVKGLCAMDSKLVRAAGECGLKPIIMMLGAMDAIECRTSVLSYEGPFGVGYAVAVMEPTGGEEPSRLEDARHRPARRAHEPIQVSLARKAVEGYVRNGEAPTLAFPIPPELSGRAGVFCSIHKGDELRGCIGTIRPVSESIAAEILRNAIEAATGDPRFAPVTKDELDYLSYKVDVLHEPEPIATIRDLDPSRYGVIVRKGHRTGLLLPRLEGIDTAEEQVAIARRKAGISPDEEVSLERFEVDRYE